MRYGEESGPPATGGPVELAAGPLPALQLSLPGFEGPIDLLVRLAEREKVDITAISLLQVTRQYLYHFRSQPCADAIALGDFVATAARLLFLKSRRLLPGPPSVAADEPEEDDHELLRALDEYRIYRHAAVQFDERSTTVGRLFPRAVPAPPPTELPLARVPIEQLINVLQDALARFPQPQPAALLPAQIVSVEEKIQEIRASLRREGLIGFVSIVERCRSRLEVVVSFIAILHLIRDGEIEAKQPQPFGEIQLLGL